MSFGGSGRLKNKFLEHRPCNSRSLFLCLVTFFLALDFLLLPLTTNIEGKNIILFIAIMLFLLDLIFVLYSLFKLNSCVFMDETKIWQKQYRKVVEIDYGSISEIKLSSACYANVPYMVKIYADKKAISFEITSRTFEKFMDCCSNIEIKNKLEALLKAKGVYL